MYKMLFITTVIDKFKSSWGVFVSLTPHQEGYIIPLGWEEELTARGIEFTEIEIDE